MLDRLVCAKRPQEASLSHVTGGTTHSPGRNPGAMHLFLHAAARRQIAFRSTNPSPRLATTCCKQAYCDVLAIPPMRMPSWSGGGVQLFLVAWATYRRAVISSAACGTCSRQPWPLDSHQTPVRYHS